MNKKHQNKKLLNDFAKENQLLKQELRELLLKHDRLQQQHNNLRASVTKTVDAYEAMLDVQEQRIKQMTQTLAGLRGIVKPLVDRLKEYEHNKQ